MTRYKPGDVVVVRAPYTDQTGAKRRPAVIVSPPQYASRNGDVVAMAITSVPQREAGLRIEARKQAGLLKPSWLKPTLLSVATSLVERSIGELATADRPAVKLGLSIAIASAFWTSTPGSRKR